MQWIKCSDRLPTEADGDLAEEVLVKSTNNSGEVSLFLRFWDEVNEDNFNEWLAGACEREGGEE